MEWFYIPENALIMCVIALAVAAVFGSLGWACVRKSEGKGKLDAWGGKYIIAMVLAMFASPFIATMFTGCIVQQFIPDLPSIVYAFALFIATLCVEKPVLQCFRACRLVIEQIRHSEEEPRPAKYEQAPPARFEQTPAKPKPAPRYEQAPPVIRPSEDDGPRI